MIGRLRLAISRQLSEPTGRGGRIIAALMNRGNRGLNERAIDLLDVQPSSRVLDVGFGGGLTFARLLDRGATVIGVDRAPDMVEAARERYGDSVEVHVGEVTALPLPDDGVDRILTVNTVYFWRDLPAAFAELRRVLAPGGRLAMGIRDGTVMDQVTPEVFTIRPADELADALRVAGFEAVEVVSAPDRKTHVLTASVG